MLSFFSLISGPQCYMILKFGRLETTQLQTRRCNLCRVMQCATDQCQGWLFLIHHSVGGLAASMVRTLLSSGQTTINNTELAVQTCCREVSILTNYWHICIAGPRNRGRLEHLRDELGWVPLETDEDKHWVPLLLHWWHFCQMEFEMFCLSFTNFLWASTQI